MTTDKINQTIKLTDGRALGYAEYGAPDGKAVFHFHGSSSSRLEHPPDEDILLTQDIRLITADRPGHGLSDFHRNRRLLDWPDDVIALADHLGIDRFAVTGWSFGGPYALACAYKIPERITAVGLISSFAPYDRPNSTAGMARFNKLSLSLARWLPFWIGRQFMKMQGHELRKNPEGAAKKMLSSLPEADQKVLNNAEVKAVLLPSLGEAYRAGADGAAWEGVILVHPWGFQLQDITIPVHIWHGDADVNDPLQCAEYLRDTIPKTHATFFPNEGHFLIMKRWGEILAELLK
jgi:pimeloyl-ACP methyl ester carboxylesterase